MENPSLSRKIHTVSEVTGIIKTLLEDALPFVWITGEISNLAKPASGHFYFTLKDEHSQIRAVMFKGQNRSMKFLPADGMKVIGLGRIAVYQPQGAYQFLLEHMEPAGIGALALAFEQLKNKLLAEGLFDDSLKKPLPFLPRCICVITSKSGAVIHDILHILSKRFENVAVEIFPVAVQGANAAKEIVLALKRANERAKADVIIIARGGGSLEDLAAFNSEELARAVFASSIPVVSAVGHETDFSICDFVADKRAATPTAAAQMVVPEKDSLLLRIDELTSRCSKAMTAKLEKLANRRIDLSDHLFRQVRQWQTLAQSLFLAQDRLSRSLNSLVLQHSRNFFHLRNRLFASSPQTRASNLDSRLEAIQDKLLYSMKKTSDKNSFELESLRRNLFFAGPFNKVQNARANCHNLHQNLVRAMGRNLDRNKYSLSLLVSSLKALGPDAVLARGYSITRLHRSSKLITKADDVMPGDLIDITLSEGLLVARITEKDAKKQLP
ncbi:MAG: exodeoxyribonuclease VII large subunit [Desulfatibacillaceae bacterium]|nr:exodeoxyribonuclease VII large subunit [Desulfatibacillaceae bacterium]